MGNLISFSCILNQLPICLMGINGDSRAKGGVCKLNVNKWN